MGAARDANGQTPSDPAKDNLGRRTSRPVVPPPSLDERPQATSYRVEDLLDLVREGAIRVRPFQRSWRWTGEDVTELFDSLYRGYPVGALLLWKRRADAETLVLGPHTLTASAREDALFVVDGQQRITALAGVLLPPSRAEDGSIFDLHFDLAEQAFVRPAPGQAPTRDWLPMHVLVDAEDLFAWLDEYRKHAPPGERVELAIRLGELVRDYEVPAYVVDSGAETVLRDMLRRVNRPGKPLNEAEVFDALHGVSGKAEPGRLDEVADSLAATGFGVFDRDLLLRTLAALVGRDLAIDHGHPPPDIAAGEILARAERALLQVIRFLRQDARIPHLRLLPYTTTIVALAVFFDRHPAPMPRNRILLARWMWRGAITGAHRGDTRSLRSTLSIIDERDESAAVTALLEALPKKPGRMSRLQGFDFRHARSKLETLALFELGPRHLSTGSLVSAVDLLSIERRREALPMIVQPRGNSSDELRERSATVANRVVHPHLETSTPRNRLFVDVPEDVARSHGVTLDAARKLAGGDRLGFLRDRSRVLEKHISEFLESRAAWSQSDRPPLQSLLIEDA